MSDPTGFSTPLRLLAYAHPLWMVASLGVAALALRHGLRLRSARKRGRAQDPQTRARHLLLAKCALVLLWPGFAGGLASALFLRGWNAFETAHGFAGAGALLLFSVTAALGHVLETGALPRARTPRERARARAKLVELHARCACAALLAAVLAFGAGFVLLP